MVRSLYCSVSAISPRLVPRAVAAALVFSAVVGPLGCESQIGLAGVEYDRKRCGADPECDPPLKCRYSSRVPFLCEPPPPTAIRKFGDAVKKGENASVCESNSASDGFCTRPCRSPADCGNAGLSACTNLKLPEDPSSSVAVCAKAR